jgi:hypothetical protein
MSLALWYEEHRDDLEWTHQFAPALASRISARCLLGLCQDLLAGRGGSNYARQVYLEYSLPAEVRAEIEALW